MDCDFWTFCGAHHLWVSWPRNCNFKQKMFSRNVDSNNPGLGLSFYSYYCAPAIIYFSRNEQQFSLIHNHLIGPAGESMLYSTNLYVCISRDHAHSPTASLSLGMLLHALYCVSFNVGTYRRTNVVFRDANHNCLYISRMHHSDDYFIFIIAFLSFAMFFVLFAAVRRPKRNFGSAHSQPHIIPDRPVSHEILRSLLLVWRFQIHYIDLVQ